MPTAALELSRSICNRGRAKSALRHADSCISTQTNGPATPRSLSGHMQPAAVQVFYRVVNNFRLLGPSLSRAVRLPFSRSSKSHLRMLPANLTRQCRSVFIHRWTLIYKHGRQQKASRRESQRMEAKGPRASHAYILHSQITWLGVLA